jgi:4'-phosphopantetheinyl transferase
MHTPGVKLPDASAAPVVMIFEAQLTGGDGSGNEQLLSADEKERARRFVFERDRGRFVAARAFLRRVLGQCVGEHPADLIFDYSPHGRPSLSACAPRPDFNLSHAGEVALLAVCWASPLGIDVETVTAATDTGAIAGQVMHPNELAEFERLAEHRRLSAFFRLWTRKEAALKALGTGLSRDPRSLDVGLGLGGDETGVWLDGKPFVIREIAAPCQLRTGLRPSTPGARGYDSTRSERPDTARNYSYSTPQPGDGLQRVFVEACSGSLQKRG